MAQFSLGKQERIKSKILMTKLFEEGKSYFKHPFSVKYLVIDKLDSTHKFAVTVPKRNFKKAVDRNKIKRLVREVYRINKSLLPINYLDEQGKTLLLIFIYVGKQPEDYNQLKKAMKKTMKQLCSRLKSSDYVG